MRKFRWKAGRGRDGREFAYCWVPRSHAGFTGWVDRLRGDTSWCAAVDGFSPCTFHSRRWQAKRAVEAAIDLCLRRGGMRPVVSAVNGLEES
jgi:hypothetical protein